MDLIKEAMNMGFSDAAVMDTDKLVFAPEFRSFCEENLCGCYNVNPACPPMSGTVEEMIQRARSYDKTLVLQTVHEDKHDPAEYKRDKLQQNKITEELAAKMKTEEIEDIMIMSAGPYKQNSCMSAYCVNAQKMADAAGMLCWVNDGKIRYFTQILFRPAIAIRQSVMEDLPSIMKTYDTARQFMRKNGNAKQWINGYPQEDLICQDIESGHSYVCIKDDQVLGTFFFMSGEDPCYNRIDNGHWSSDKPYAVVHRIASSGQVHGILKKCLDYCSQTADYLRIDTHRDNIPMQSALKKYGFRECGVVYMEDGTERIAFDRL